MKVIALNSGGFDSIILMHFLKEQGYEIISLFFDYGQNNVEQERKCAEKVCEKLEVDGYYITLPTFTWSESSVVKLDRTKSQYIEWRNLIFLSYAISLAEGMKAEAVIMALINNASTSRYPDCTADFIEKMDKLTPIHVYAPFSTFYKTDVACLALSYNITRDDYFSCNTPVDGKPCGECDDCISIEELHKYILDCNYPYQAWLRKDFNRFKELFFFNNIHEVRILNTDLCQFKCKHCFYGFDSMKGEQLSLEEYKDFIDQCAEFGIKNIHFSGREPLCDENIFSIMDYVKENYPNMTYNVISNGVFIPKYIDRLKKAGVESIFLSVDSLIKNKSGNIRPVNSGIVKAIKTVLKSGIPLQVFVDIHAGNKDIVYSIYSDLYDLGVRSIFTRPVKQIGKCPKEVVVSPEGLESAFVKIVEFAESHSDCRLEFSIDMTYYDWIMEHTESKLNEFITMLEEVEGFYFYDNFTICVERYCERYQETITLTPDGYILGCATEVSYPDYDEIASGNIRESKLADLVRAGKENQLEIIEQRHIKKNCCSLGCYHKNRL